MNINELHQYIEQLFPIKRNNDSFREDLSQVLKKYLDNIDSIPVETVTYIPNWSDLKVRIKKLITHIEKSVESYYLGMRNEAYRVLQSDIMGDDGIINSIGLHTITKEEETLDGKRSTYFFRARFFQDKNDKTYRDMFHIPLNMRGRVSTQRYSYPGYPCLYLGTSFYACWEELLRPRFDDVMFSGFKVTRTFKLFDLRIPAKTDFEEDKLSNVLLRLPLIIACSFPVWYPNDQFKPEYIIPQLLTEIIISNNRKAIEQNYVAIDELVWGIIYTSTHNNESFGFGSDFQQNIALPVIQADRNDYCHVLASLFALTQPTCNEYEEVKSMQPYLFGAPPTDFEEKKRYAYSISKFAFIEGKLRSMPTKELPYLYVTKPKILIPQNGEGATCNVVSNQEWHIE